MTRLTLKNFADAPKQISLYGVVEFCLWNAMDDMSNFQRNFSTGEVEVEPGAVYHKTEYRERRNHFAVWAVNRETAGFDTDRESFFGLYNGFDAPRSVLTDSPSNSVASGWAPIGALNVRLTLAPGEEASMIFTLGYCENPEEEKFEAPGVINKAPARVLLDAFRTDAQFDEALNELKAYWAELLSNYQVKSTDEKLDRMVNVWNQYQCMVTFNMSPLGLLLRVRHRPWHGLQGLHAGPARLRAPWSLKGRGSGFWISRPPSSRTAAPTTSTSR